MRLDGHGVAPLKADVSPTRATLMVALGLIATNVVVFAAIAEDVVHGGRLVSHDEAVLTWFVDHRTDATIRAAQLVSALGGFAGLVTAGVLIGVWLWRRGTSLDLAAVPLLSLLFGSLASTTAKGVFGRDRPPLSLHATNVTLAAFPSGHATDAAAFFVAASLILSMTVARRRSSQVKLIGTGLFLAALIGLSRLVLAVHWLSDVVAGWALGSAVAIAVVGSLWFIAGHQVHGSGRNVAP